MIANIDSIDDLMDLLLGQSGLTDRFVQDSPLLADVWRAYADTSRRRIDVLVTPNRTTSAASIANALKNAPGIRHGPFKDGELRLAWLDGTVAVRLSFTELVMFVLPRTAWFKNRLLPQLGSFEPDSVYRAVALLYSTLQSGAVRSKKSITKGDRKFDLSHRSKGLSNVAVVDAEFLEIARFIFLIGAIATLRSSELTLIDYQTQRESTWLVDKVADGAWSVLSQINVESLMTRQPTIFHVTLNRPVSLAISESIPTVKGDACLEVFSVSCRQINWAILDSGIDASHPAFADHSRSNQPVTSRVLAALDFTSLRLITSVDILLHDGDRSDLAAQISQQSVLRRDVIEKNLKRIGRKLDQDQRLDWELVETLLKLPRFVVPLDHHGTHVAGTLAADWRENEERKMLGVCPDIRLYDFRVVGHSAEDTEFAIIGALQYIRWLNNRNNYIAIHGANISLQIEHDVGNYACGQTPVCLACERVVDSGTVVVAAAGNLGSHVYQTANGPYRGYANSSITDPGNADSAITVGATHRFKPHSYGISYFSGRGPTGDGRLKPDIVAPGERIEAPCLGGAATRLDGTSMAAPHVSGAAALIMARHKEFVGKPREIKEILMSTATDLGREKYFQGSGLLDIFRALQSV